MKVTTRVVAPLVPSAMSPQYCWVWLWQPSQKTPFSNWKSQNEAKPRDLQKTLGPTQGKPQGKERHEPARPPCCPHHWQDKFSLGMGSASSLPSPMVWAVPARGVHIELIKLSKPHHPASLEVGSCPWASAAPQVSLPESVQANKENALPSTLIKAKWCRLPITKTGRRLKTHWIITHVTDQSFYD